MLRILASAAISALVLVGQASLGAEPVPMQGPPPWKDAASLYLVNHQAMDNGQRRPEQPMPSERAAIPEALPPAESGSANGPAPDFTLPAGQATQDRPASPIEYRRLAPPSDRARESLAAPASQDGRFPRPIQRLAGASPVVRTVYPVVSALAIVLGAFFGCVWLSRRGSRNTAAALPAEVVSVLGRVPLAARHFAQLLRVGNKLVLVSVTPNGAEALAEVSDPIEVDRLAGLCRQIDPHSTTKAFEQVFRQLASEPATSEFLANEALPGHSSTLPEIGQFRTERGEAPHG